MKKQTRASVFETNSSSSHSLTFGNSKLNETPFPPEILKSGVVSIQAREYGEEWFRYYSTVGKLEYLLTQLSDGRVTNATSKTPEFTLLYDVVKEFTGCTLLAKKSRGGIDHQSAREEAAVGLELFKNKEKLCQFLFDSASYVQTGNDNSHAPWIIETDRGSSELFYVNHMREIPPKYVALKLRRVDTRFDAYYLTEGSAALSKAFNVAMLRKLSRVGLVQKLEEFQPLSPRSEYEPEERSTSRYAGGLVKGYQGLPPISLTNDFSSNFENKGSLKKSVTELEVFVPQRLFDEIGKIPATPETLIELHAALDDHEVEVYRAGTAEVRKGKTTEALQEASKKVDLLTAKAIREGVL